MKNEVAIGGNEGFSTLERADSSQEVRDGSEPRVEKIQFIFFEILVRMLILTKRHF